MSMLNRIKLAIAALSGRPNTELPPRVKDVRLVTDIDGHEAIYVDGKLEATSNTLYMCEVAQACGSGPVTLRHHNAEELQYPIPKNFSEVVLEENPTPYAKD